MMEYDLGYSLVDVVCRGCSREGNMGRAKQSSWMTMGGVLRISGISALLEEPNFSQGQAKGKTGPSRTIFLGGIYMCVYIFNGIG